MNTFFVSCPMGFEKELIQEIENFWFQMMDLDGLPTREPLPEFELDRGGIEFKTPLHLGLQINLFTRIALRVLLRIESFEARYFDQFEKGMSQVKFEKYFSEPSIRVQIESVKSRLFHESNLMESCTRVLKNKKIEINNDADIGLFIRLVKDRVQLSLDTSGQHLHFRGYRKHQGEAPLRENLASLILQVSKLPHIEQVVVFDPYCGSGTFFFEAQILNIPHFNRDYAFLKLKNIPAVFKSETWKKNFRWVKPVSNKKYFGIEKNIETEKKLQLNQKEFATHFEDFSLETLQGDSESLKIDQIEKRLGDKPLYIVTNPPYGERSQLGDVIQNLQRFEQLPHLRQISVIHPEHWKFNFKQMFLKQTVDLSNQGLKTRLSIFERSKPKIV